MARFERSLGRCQRQENPKDSTGNKTRHYYDHCGQELLGYTKCPTYREVLTLKHRRAE